MSERVGEMDQKQFGTGFPASGALLLVTLIFGTLFVVQHPFHVRRPSVDEESLDSRDEDVTARLWEDPFSAMQRKRLEPARNSSLPRSDHSPDSLAEEIARAQVQGS